MSTTIKQALWPSHLLIKDQVLGESYRQELTTLGMAELYRQGRWPSCNVSTKYPPSWLAKFHLSFDQAFREYCEYAGVDPERYELVDFNINAIASYDANMYQEQNYTPHQDIAAGGSIAGLYYVDCYEEHELESFVGGELSIYRRMSVLDYPDHCVNVALKRDRMVFFPAHHVHQVNPYFGLDRPRLTIAALYNLERDVLQNQKPVRF